MGMILNQLLMTCPHIHSLIHVLPLIRKKFYVQYALGLLFLWWNMTKASLGRKWFTWLTFPSFKEVKTETQTEQEAGAGADAKTEERWYILASSRQDHQLRCETTHHWLGHHPSIISYENRLEIDLLEAFSVNSGFILSDDYSLCQLDIKLVRTQ